MIPLGRPCWTGPTLAGRYLFAPTAATEQGRPLHWVCWAPPALVRLPRTLRSGSLAARHPVPSTSVHLGSSPPPVQHYAQYPAAGEGCEGLRQRHEQPTLPRLPPGCQHCQGHAIANAPDTAAARRLQRDPGHARPQCLAHSQLNVQATLGSKSRGHPHRADMPRRCPRWTCLRRFSAPAAQPPCLRPAGLRYRSPGVERTALRGVHGNHNLPPKGETFALYLSWSS
mmetsp:Transcript_15068/g.34254  ORF Transcript_15068/g.34254 Transcript_15068/m.34254 type:complete len:227 (+) Transcript_15068:300-980(+)